MPNQPLPKKPNSILDFGVEFQQQLIAEIVTDRRFGNQIIDIIEPEYFKNQYFGFIIKIIKEYYKKHDVIPNYIGIRIEIDSMYSDVVETHKTLVDTLEGIRNCTFNNANIQEITLKFCKWQSVRNTVEVIHKKLNVGVYEDYNEIEDLVRTAIAFKEDDEGINFFTDIKSALEDNYREPIPTGIEGIDTITNGGLGKGELGVIIAPLGVGKTTILTMFASNAYQNNFNVLHIFFEDKLNEVRRKYLTHWSKIPLQELNDNKEFVFNECDKVMAARPNVNLILVKLKPDKMTIPKLRQVIKRERNKAGGKIDMVIVDYADCIIGEQGANLEDWVGEGRTMRQLEGMADEFNVALWTAVQGGRKSTSASVVEVDMIGGNIKKAQVAHFIMSIAKTLTQKDQKLATIAILKSRFGDDGKVFEGCTFDNARMLVNTSTMQTFDAFDQVQHHRAVERIREITQAFRADQAVANQVNQKS